MVNLTMTPSGVGDEAEAISTSEGPTSIPSAAAMCSEAGCQAIGLGIRKSKWVDP